MVFACSSSTCCSASTALAFRIDVSVTAFRSCSCAFISASSSAPAAAHSASVFHRVRSSSWHRARCRSPTKQTAPILQVELRRLFTGRIRLLRQEFLEVGTPHSPRVPAFVHQQVDHQVACNSQQPSAERTPGRIGILPTDRLRYGQQDFLGQLQSVGVLEPFLFQ